MLRRRNVALFSRRLPPTQIDFPDRDINEDVMEKVMHDNKRGYLPEREGFCPFILAQKIGEMHAPNKWYLEYVPNAVVRHAIEYVVDRMRVAGRVESSEVSDGESASERTSPKSTLTSDKAMLTLAGDKAMLKQGNCMSRAPTREKELFYLASLSSNA